MKQKGFTLIELLVVISIIGVLAAIVLVALNTARAKSRDVRKIADFHQLQNALNLFYEKNNRMPANYGPGGACSNAGTSYYQQSMQELVTAGFMGEVPMPPDASSYYCYYDYGGQNPRGALLVTALEAVPSSTTGLPPSVRPWLAGTNWCDTSSTTQYCIATTY